MINSQLVLRRRRFVVSISKGMGDQFSASVGVGIRAPQYIKGDG